MAWRHMRQEEEFALIVNLGGANSDINAVVARLSSGLGD